MSPRSGRGTTPGTSFRWRRRPSPRLPTPRASVAGIPVARSSSTEQGHRTPAPPVALAQMSSTWLASPMRTANVRITTVGADAEAAPRRDGSHVLDHLVILFGRLCRPGSLACRGAVAPMVVFPRRHVLRQPWSIRASSVRERTPSLRYTRVSVASTVFGVTKRRAAISPFRSPSLASAATRASVGVRPSPAPDLPPSRRRSSSARASQRGLSSEPKIVLASSRRAAASRRRPSRRRISPVTRSVRACSSGHSSRSCSASARSAASRARPRRPRVQRRSAPPTVPRSRCPRGGRAASRTPRAPPGARSPRPARRARRAPRSHRGGRDAPPIRRGPCPAAGAEGHGRRVVPRRGSRPRARGGRALRGGARARSVTRTPALRRLPRGGCAAHPPHDRGASPRSRWDTTRPRDRPAAGRRGSRTRARVTPRPRSGPPELDLGQVQQAARGRADPSELDGELEELDQQTACVARAVPYRAGRGRAGASGSIGSSLRPIDSSSSIPGVEERLVEPYAGEEPGGADSPAGDGNIMFPRIVSPPAPARSAWTSASR